MRTFFKCDLVTRVDDAMEQEAADARAERALFKAVDARDGRNCRCCGRKSDPNAICLTKRGHRHHIVYRSAGGSDTTANLVTICYECHNDEHQHRLRIEGNADDALTFWRHDKDGWYVWARELSVGVFEKD
jgi:hypothetical protein